MARGAAYADLDGDGDLDVDRGRERRPGAHLRQPARPAPAERRASGSSARASPTATPSGARVTATIGGRTLAQQVSGGQSYLSAPEKTLTFGLGAAAKIDTLEIRWPDGRAETYRDLPGGTTTVLTEGSGKGP